MNSWSFRPMGDAEAREVLAWHYESPYDIYNADPMHIEESVAGLVDPANQYFVASDAEGRILGYCCFGPDARVPGGDYRDPDLLDVGLGMRPDLTGQGHGPAFFGVVLTFGREQLGARRFRLSVAAFNHRAMRVYERAGFREVGRFRRGGRLDDLEFVVMLGDG
jgi:ribosomal-protein-alanine N-acetyltransferase